MAWSDGTDRNTGDLVTAAQWNALLGASGSLMTLKSHAHGGTTGHGSQAVGPLTSLSFGATPASAGEIRMPTGSVLRVRKADDSGDLTWFTFGGTLIIGGTGVTGINVWDTRVSAVNLLATRLTDGSGHLSNSSAVWVAY